MRARGASASYALMLCRACVRSQPCRARPTLASSCRSENTTRILRAYGTLTESVSALRSSGARCALTFASGTRYVDVADAAPATQCVPSTRQSTHSECRCSSCRTLSHSFVGTTTAHAVRMGHAPRASSARTASAGNGKRSIFVSIHQAGTHAAITHTIDARIRTCSDVRWNEASAAPPIANVPQRGRPPPRLIYHVIAYAAGAVGAGATSMWG